MNFPDAFDWTEGIEQNAIYSDNKILISSHKTSKVIKQLTTNDNVYK